MKLSKRDRTKKSCLIPSDTIKTHSVSQLCSGETFRNSSYFIIMLSHLEVILQNDWAWSRGIMDGQHQQSALTLLHGMVVLVGIHLSLKRKKYERLGLLCINRSSLHYV